MIPPFKINPPLFPHKLLHDKPAGGASAAVEPCSFLRHALKDPTWRSNQSSELWLLHECYRLTIKCHHPTNSANNKKILRSTAHHNRFELLRNVELRKPEKRWKSKAPGGGRSKVRSMTPSLCRWGSAECQRPTWPSQREEEISLTAPFSPTTGCATFSSIFRGVLRSPPTLVLNNDNSFRAAATDQLTF